MVVNVPSRRCLKTKLSVFVLAAVLWSSPARGEVLFEGYSKVLLDGVHVGYTVQRYEFDPKKKEFKTSYFLKTNQLAGNITESLQARASADFKPISYQFTELVGDKPRTIDAQFNGDTMTAKINQNGQIQTIQKKLPKGTFLSSFLAYVMLQGKEGIKTGAKYTYSAVAEEDAGVYSGEAFVKGEETVNGITAFKILNTFKGVQFVSYSTFKGEVIATRSPVQKVATELVAGIKEATAGFPVNSKTISQIFGDFPKGVDNPISRRAPETVTKVETPQDEAQEQKKKTLESAPAPGTSPKKEGVPGGKGIIIKGNSSEPSPNPEK